METFYDWRKLEVGHVYNTSFTDCCVNGSFTATLSAIEFDREDADKYYPTLVWSNGLRVEDNGCGWSFTETIGGADE